MLFLNLQKGNDMKKIMLYLMLSIVMQIKSVDLITNLRSLKTSLDTLKHRLLSSTPPSPEKRLSKHDDKVPQVIKSLKKVYINAIAMLESRLASQQEIDFFFL